MAFGKDRDVLKRVTNLREANNATRGRPRASGSSGAWQRFQDQFKPGVGDPDTIRFVPGDYPYTKVNVDNEGNILGTSDLLLPYFVFTEHWDARTKGSTICSGGVYSDWKDKRDPCVGCDIYWESGGHKGGRISRREMRAFTIFNYSTFHEVDSIDYKTGQPRMNTKTNKPFTEWAKCEGRRCNACTEGRPTKKGHLQHYSLGFGHFGQVKEYSKIIGKGCLSCKTRSVIDPLAYLCPHCKDAVIDMSTTHLTNEEITKMIDNDVFCPHCRQKGLLDEIVQCSNCDNPVRAGIFDVDIKFKKVAGAEGTNASTLMFEEFGPICDVDPVYEIKTFDFPKIFAPTSLEDQAKKFKQPPSVSTTPRQPVPASEVARGYGGAPAPADATPPSPPRGGGMFNR